MSNRVTPSVFGALALAVVLAGATAAGQDRREPPASRALITDVPFVSWHDAALVRHADEEIMNPSMIASMWMLRGYWTGAVQTRAEFEAAYARVGGALPELTTLSDVTPDRIRRSIADGVPVLLTTTPLTRVAHPLSVTFGIGIALGSYPKPHDQGPRSGLLGPMISLEDIRRFTQQRGTNPVAESLHLAARIVVGYDDERRVFVIHDPTFGPAWELGYDDFERMWDVSARAAAIAIPRNVHAVAAAPQSEPPYRSRTAEERAAERFILGYALSATGHPDEGEQQFREGLALEGLSVGYRHLLLFELALTLRATGRLDEAIDAARGASELVPENGAVWATLVELYTSSSKPAAGSLRKDAEKRVKKLAGDRPAQQRLAAAIPSDFWILPLAPARGWARP